jgi:hypothetical protein
LLTQGFVNKKPLQNTYLIYRTETKALESPINCFIARARIVYQLSKPCKTLNLFASRSPIPIRDRQTAWITVTALFHNRGQSLNVS